MVSVLHLAFFIVLGGVLRWLSQLSIDEVKAGQGSFERPIPRGRNSDPLLDFLIQRKRNAFVPFTGRRGKFFLLSAPIRTIFASLLGLSIFLRTLWPSKSTLVTAPTTGSPSSIYEQLFICWPLHCYVTRAICIFIRICMEKIMIVSVTYENVAI